jgi:hypothetical protein
MRGEKRETTEERRNKKREKREKYKNLPTSHLVKQSSFLSSV